MIIVEFTWKNWEKLQNSSVRIAGNLDKIWARYFLNIDAELSKVIKQFKNQLFLLPTAFSVTIFMYSYITRSIFPSKLYLKIWLIGNKTDTN